MVRQRKDGDSVERTDGSKPTWKVFLAVFVLNFISVRHVSVWPLCASPTHNTYCRVTRQVNGAKSLMCPVFETSPCWFEASPETSTHYIRLSGSIHRE